MFYSVGRPSAEACWLWCPVSSRPASMRARRGLSPPGRWWPSASCTASWGSPFAEGGASMPFWITKASTKPAQLCMRKANTWSRTSSGYYFAHWSRSRSSCSISSTCAGSTGTSLWGVLLMRVGHRTGALLPKHSLARTASRRVPSSGRAPLLEGLSTPWGASRLQALSPWSPWLRCGKTPTPGTCPMCTPEPFVYRLKALAKAVDGDTWRFAKTGEVLVRAIKEEKYGRMLADCYRAGEPSLCTELLERGLARPYTP